MKRTKKIWLAVVLGGVLAFGGVGTYFGGRYLLLRRALVWRRDGIAAAQAGDNAKAADLLVRYLNRRPRDLEALEYYVNARELAPLPNGQHLAEAVGGLKLILSLDPSRLDDRRHLLELYARLERGPETVDLANAILAKVPGDLRTLQLKTETLMRMQQHREALATAEAWTKLAPGDVKAQMDRLTLNVRVGRPAADVVADAQALREAHAGDPKFELLQGFAYAQAGDDAQAAQWFKTAGKHDDLSGDLALLLVQQFDALGMSGDSLAILQRLTRRGAGADARDALAKRAWEMGKWALVVETLNTLSPTDKAADPTLLAFKATALANTSDAAGASACRQALAARTDPASQAWTNVLRRLVDAAKVDDKQIVETCKSALAGDPGNSYLSYYLGDGYARMGELDLAIGSFRRAAVENTNWTVPASRLVEVLLQKGRPEEAVEVASIVARRNPTSAGAVITLARAWAAGVETGGAGQADELLKLVSGVQRQLPGEQRTLLIQIQLLAQQGKKADAWKIATDAINRTPAPEESVFLAVAAISRKYGLDLEAASFSACERAHGKTARLAYSEAVDQFMSGHADAGLARFDAMAKDVAKPDDMAWKLMRAEYLDVTGNPAAKAAWVALRDGYPKNLAVQQAAVTGRTVQGDWDFLQPAIDHLHALTGDDGLAWRLAQARLLVLSPRTDEDCDKGSVQINELLQRYPELPELHVLLARALVHMKRTDGAIEHLSIAARLDPSSVTISLQLASLLQSRGDFDRVQQELDRITPQLHSQEQRRQAAMLMAQTGKSDQAVKLLESAPHDAVAAAGDQGDDLFLAMLHRQRRENDKAEAIVQKLLRTPDLKTVQFAAGLYASEGRTADAEKTLGLLDSLTLDPGIKELTWGSYCAQTGRLPQAIEHYRAATEQAPTNDAAWRTLATCQMAVGNPADALTTIDAALRAVPNDKGFAVIKAQASLLTQADGEPSLRPVVLGVMQDPGNSDAAVELLQIVTEGRASFDMERLAGRLQQFAERHADFLPAQMQLVQCYMDMGRSHDAIAAARQAANAFPNSAEPARVTAQICSATDHWQELQAAAQLWKSRAPEEAEAADLAIARSQLARKQYDAVLNQLQPYASAAAADPEKHPDVVTIQCAALAGAGQVQQAHDVLWALAQKSQGWRVRFLQVAAQVPDRREAARWVDQLNAIVPADASVERLTIAESYDQLGAALADEKLTGLAGDMYAQLSAAPNAPPLVLLAAASRAERHGDPTTAEALYRRAVTLDPTLWIAHNNLAMLIIKGGGDPKEATAFAATAARLQPRQPSVRDTLADVQHRAGDFKGAADSENAAIRLDPDNVRWKLRFAQYVLDAGDVGEAQRTVQLIEGSGDAFSHLPPAEQASLSAQLDDIKKRLRGSKTL